MSVALVGGAPLAAGLKEAVEKVVPSVPSAAPVVAAPSKRAVPDPEAPFKAGKVLPWLSAYHAMSLCLLL